MSYSDMHVLDSSIYIFNVISLKIDSFRYMFF